MVFSQTRIEINPFGGYLLGGSVKFYEGKFKIENNACYGGNMSVLLGNGNHLEIGYTRMDTKGNWEPYSAFMDDYPRKTIDVAVNYLQIGEVKELELDNEAIKPYGVFSLGTTWFHPKVDNGEDEWLFSVSAGLGLKYFFTERIGIRVQARLLLPLVFDGAGFYMGIGTGGVSSGVGVTSTAPIVQGDFTGGLVFVLGDTE